MSYLIEMNKKMSSGSIKKIAVTIGLFHSFRLLTGPINIIYLLDQGMNLQEIAKLQVIFCITSLLVTYPIGVASDIYSNKILMIIGISVSSLHYLLYFNFFNINHLIFAQILLGIGLSLIDVNGSSWVAKEVKIANFSLNKIDYYSHLEEEIRSFYGFFITIFFCLFTLFVSGGIFYKAIYICTFFLILILLCFVFNIKENKDNSNINFYKNKKNLYYQKNTFFVVFVILSGFIWGAYQSLFHYWQPLLSSKHFYMPYFFSCNINLIMGLSFLASNFSVYFSNKLFKKIALINLDFYLLGGCLTILGAILFFAIGVLLPTILPCIAGFSILHGCMSVLWKLIRNQCMKTVNAKIYGKLISASNLFCRIVGLIVSLLFAKVLYLRSIEILFVICSGFMLLAFLFF